MKKVNELLDIMQPMRKEVKKRCLAYLKRVLKKEDGGRLDFVDEDGNPRKNKFVCVTYDGGAHPEYAANAFSLVKAIYLNKDNKIVLDTDDDDEYSIEKVYWEEMVNIADYVYKVLKK